jgi:hypothetical protein
MVWSKNNDLGGREYCEEEQLILMQLVQKLKARDTEHRSTFTFSDDDVRPKDYIYLYTKAAGVVWEAAKHLAIAGATDKRLAQKPVREWVRILSGIRLENLSSKLEKKLLERGADAAPRLGTMPDGG